MNPNERPESAWLYWLRTSETAQVLTMAFVVIGMVAVGVIASDLIQGREPELIAALRTAALEMLR